MILPLLLGALSLAAPSRAEAPPAKSSLTDGCRPRQAIKEIDDEIAEQLQNRIQRFMGKSPRDQWGRPR